MRIRGITTKVRRVRGVSFIAYVELHKDGRIVAETSCGPSDEEIKAAEIDLKCGYLHLPVPREDEK